MKNEPRWKQIKEGLITEIKQNGFKKGDRFYSLPEISQRYRVSDITSRRALLELSQENWVERIQGKGTFIKNSPSSREIKLVLPPGEQFPHDHHKHMIFTEIIRGIMQGAGETNSQVNTVTFSFLKSQVKDNELVLVIYSVLDRETYRLITEKSLLCVCTYACGPLEGVSTVRLDREKGAYLATQHLISRRHHRIGFISGKIEDEWFASRFEGYYQTLKRSSIPLSLDLIKETEGLDPEEDKRAINQLLSLGNPPTAVFCGNDLRALRVLEHCKDKGIKVPEDLAVVGFDNMYESSVSEPPLTTVDACWRKQGEEAVKLLLALAEGEEGRDGDSVIQPELIVRGST